MAIEKPTVIRLKYLITNDKNEFKKLSDYFRINDNEFYINTILPIYKKNKLNYVLQIVSLGSVVIIISFIVYFTQFSMKQESERNISGTMDTVRQNTTDIDINPNDLIAVDDNVKTIDNSNGSKDTRPSYQRVTDLYKKLGVRVRKSYKFTFKIDGTYSDKGSLDETELYDLNGNMTGTQNTDDMIKSFKYDYSGRLIEAFENHQIYQYWRNSYENISYKDVYIYYKSGILEKVVKYSIISNSISLYSTSEYTYDDNNNIIELRERNDKGQTIIEHYRTYNGQGFIQTDSWINHLSKKKYDAEKGKIEYKYDSEGKLFEAVYYFGNDIKYKYQYRYEFYHDNYQSQSYSNPTTKTPKSSSNIGNYRCASERKLTSSDLSNISKYELKIMRNEIFARHGYIFKTEEMKNYFSKQDWYQARFDNVDDMLNDVEKYNIELIRSYEK